MKSRILFFAFFALLSFGKAMAQADTNAVFTETEDVMEEADEEAFIDYSTTKLDTPIYSIGVDVLTMPFGNKLAFGGSVSGKVNFRTNQAFGLHVDYMGSSINEDYGYIVGDPMLMHWNAGAFYEYTFLTAHRFQAGFRMYAGVSGFNLKDDSIKEIYTWYDEWGNAYQDERAITIDKNIFLRLAPGIHLSYSITPGLAVAAQATYDFYVGDPNFGKISQFNNYTIGAGVVFRLNPSR